MCVRVCVRERVTRGKITPLFACSSSPGATSRKCVFLFLLVVGLSCPTQFLAYGLAPRFVVHLWFPTLLDEESRRVTDQVQQYVGVLAIPRFWQHLSYISFFVVPPTGLAKIIAAGKMREGSQGLRLRVALVSVITVRRHSRPWPWPMGFCHEA